jgi:hypothetical protein
MFGVITGTFMWIGVIATLTKLFYGAPTLPWIVVTYPLWGTLTGVFLLGFCERYQPGGTE